MIVAGPILVGLSVYLEVIFLIVGVYLLAALMAPLCLFGIYLMRKDWK